MKEKENFVGTKEKIKSLASLGILTLALITLLSSCTFSIQQESASSAKILSLLQDRCTEVDNSICWTELRTARTDLYDYHCWTVVWDGSGSPLELDGAEVFPSLEDCPPGSMSLSPRQLKDRCLVFLDNGNRRLDYNDKPVRHLCVLNP